LIHISISRLINANSLRRFKKIITEVKRLTSKEGANLKTIKIVIDDRLKFEKLIRDRQIQIMGMLAKPVSEWVRCSKEHSHSDCNMDKVKGPFKCGNCGGDHAAVDRSCPALKKYMQKDKTNATQMNMILRAYSQPV